MAITLSQPAHALLNAACADDPGEWFVARLAFIEGIEELGILPGETRATSLIDQVARHVSSDGEVEYYGRALTVRHAFWIQRLGLEYDPRAFFVEDGLGCTWTVLNGYPHPRSSGHTPNDVAVLMLKADDPSCGYPELSERIPVPVRIEDVPPNPGVFDGFAIMEGQVGCEYPCNYPYDESFLNPCPVACTMGCCPVPPFDGVLFGRRTAPIAIEEDQGIEHNWVREAGDILVYRVGRLGQPEERCCEYRTECYQPFVWSSGCGGDSGSPLLFPDVDDAGARYYRVPGLDRAANIVCRPPETYADYLQPCYSDNQCRYSRTCEQGLCQPSGQLAYATPLTAPVVAAFIDGLELPTDPEDDTRLANTAPCLYPVGSALCPLDGPTTVDTPSRQLYQVADAEANGPFELQPEYLDEDGEWQAGFPPELHARIEPLIDGVTFAVELGQNLSGSAHRVRLRVADNLAFSSDWVLIVVE